MKGRTLFFLLLGVMLLSLVLVPALGAPQNVVDNIVKDALALPSNTVVVDVIPAGTFTPTVIATLSPTFTQSTTPSPTSSPTATAILLHNLEVMFALGDSTRADSTRCTPTLSWDEVLPKLGELGLVVDTGSVQPFRIPKYNAAPNSKTICFGYYIVPAAPGNGYLVYRDSVDIQVVPCSYTQEDIDVGVFHLFKGTTPTPEN